MTLYIRPVKIVSEPTTGQQSSTNFDIDLTITVNREEKWVFWFTFSVNQSKAEKTDAHFIGCNPKMRHKITLKRQPRSIKSRINQQPPLAQVQTDLNAWLQNFKGGKNKIQQKDVKIGRFTVTFEFKYNKWIQICGNSTFQEFTLEKSEDPKHNKNQEQFLVGECKHKNIFSYFDPSNLPESQKKFGIIQKPYIKN